MSGCQPFYSYSTNYFKNVHAQVSFEVCKSRQHKTPDVKYPVARTFLDYIYTY